MNQLIPFFERLDQDAGLRKGFDVASGSGALDTYLLGKGFPLVAAILQDQDSSFGPSLSSLEMDMMAGQDWQTMGTTSTCGCNAESLCSSTCK